MTSTRDTFTLRMERVLPATPDAVWQALTSSADVAKWFNPFPDADAEVQELDVRVGGALRISFRTPEGHLVQFIGVYTTVVPPHELAFDFTDDPSWTNNWPVQIRLLPHGLTTRMQFEQANVPIGDTAEIGWNRQFEKLARLVRA